MTALRRPPDVVIPARPDDPRLGHMLGRALSVSMPARVALVGFPVDEGVRRNGGRVGAAGGPSAIRRQLYRLTPDPRNGEAFVDLVEHTTDLGDVVPTGDLEKDQQVLGEVVAELLRAGTIPIILGGGHETAYGHFLGHVAAGRSVAIVNWDAHPDVRPTLEGKGHAGSPFRQALEHGPEICRGYSVLGLNPHAVARAHLDWMRSNRGFFRFRDEVDRDRVVEAYGGGDGDLMASFDLDAVDGAAAPGVSAPATPGLSVDLWLRAAFEAGRSNRVRSMDLVELIPALDQDDRTARLAAVTVWEFLRGLCAR